MVKPARLDASHKLVNAPWTWIDADIASNAATNDDTTLVNLQRGYGLLNKPEFVAALARSELEVILLPDRCAALVTWGKSVKGLTLNILTVTGTMDAWRHVLPILEHAAKNSGAEMIMSICAPGWKHIAEENGYRTNMRLFIAKDLTS